MTADLTPHLPTQGTENCRVDVARLVLPATASVTTSFWLHASAPAAAYHEKETCFLARHQVGREGQEISLVLAATCVANAAMHQHSLVCRAVPHSRCADDDVKWCTGDLTGRVIAEDLLLTVPSATHDCSLLLDTTVACAAVYRISSSSMAANATSSCAHHVDDWRERSQLISISQLKLCCVQGAHRSCNARCLGYAAGRCMGHTKLPRRQAERASWITESRCVCMSY